MLNLEIIKEIEELKQNGVVSTDIFNILTEKHSFEIAEEAKHLGLIGKFDTNDTRKYFETSGIGFSLVIFGFLGIFVAPDPFAAFSFVLLGLFFCALYAIFPNHRSHNNFPIKFKL